MSSTSAVLVVASVFFSIETFLTGSLGSRKGFLDVAAAGNGNCCTDGSIVCGECDCTLNRLRKGLLEDRREGLLLLILRVRLSVGEGRRSVFAAAAKKASVDRRALKQEAGVIPAVSVNAMIQFVRPVFTGLYYVQAY